MAEGFNEIAANPYFIVVASLASIFGTLLALSVFFPPQKKPCYAIRSFNLINQSSSRIENLDIKYKIYDSEGELNTEDIQSLSISKILFWNGGRKIINQEDIAKSQPITIKSRNNEKIYKIEIIEGSISTSASNIQIGNINKEITFDFLETCNGFVVEVLHSGLSSESIFIDGYIKDSYSNDIMRIDTDSILDKGNEIKAIYINSLYSSFVIVAFPLIASRIMNNEIFIEESDPGILNYLLGFSGILLWATMFTLVSLFSLYLLKNFTGIRYRIPKRCRNIFYE